MTDTEPRFDPMTGQPIDVPFTETASDAPPGNTLHVHATPNEVHGHYGDGRSLAVNNGPAPSRRLTRAEVLEIRRREREEGVDFELAKTGMTAKVRDLPFTDRTMLMGIPIDMRASLNTALGFSKNATEGEVPDVETALGIVQGMEDLANALCIAGFISPRLVRFESELDGNDDCWLVEDLHITEREAYQKFVMRDRDAEQEVARLATFPGAEVAEAATG